MKPGKLNKVIVYVHDMQRMVEFYRDTLGLKLAYPTRLDNYAGEMWVAFDAGGNTFALHGGGTQSPTTGAPRFGFEVADIYDCRTELLTMGVDVGEIRAPVPDTQVLDCIDPEGNGFFLEQHN